MLNKDHVNSKNIHSIEITEIMVRFNYNNMSDDCLRVKHRSWHRACDVPICAIYQVDLLLKLV